MTKAHPEPYGPKIDRLFAAALGISLAGHIVVLAGQLVMVTWHGSRRPPRPLKLVYEQPATPQPSRWTPEALRPNRSESPMLPGPSSAGLQPSSGEDRQRGGNGVMASELANLQPQIRIGPQASDRTRATWSDDRSTWAAAVDLTNLAEAAQGNPVLLSYFGTIREKIQRTANTQTWFPKGEVAGGIVYIGFDLTRTGAMQSAAIVPGRSTASSTLCDIALRIVKASNPFLPFPPSLQGSSKTIVVPLEFISSQ